MLTNYDYLIGIEDFTRMGGIRYKEKEGDDYINASAKYLVPPIESLRALCEACHEIELAEERNELPEQRWLDQLIDPGTSLGGARPKANVVDTDGKLYVAKFPSKKVDCRWCIGKYSRESQRKPQSLQPSFGLMWGIALSWSSLH